MSNAAAHIRNDLKAAGFSLRAISVRTSRGTGSVTIEIKDAAIAKSRVEKIANRHEVVRRAEDGDILCGGNTFVFVRYAREALQAAGVELTARLRAGERTFGSVEVIHDGSDRAHTWHLWATGDAGRHLRQIAPFDGAALAELLADRGELARAAPQAPAAPAQAPELAAAPTPAVASSDELARAMLGC